MIAGRNRQNQKTEERNMKNGMASLVKTVMMRAVALVLCAACLLGCAESAEAAVFSGGSVDLLTLEPYYEGTVTMELNGIEDTLGNRYASALRGFMSPGDAANYNLDCFDIWDIGGAYRTLTATVMVRRRDRGSRHEGSFRIYGDGHLLYAEDGIGSMTKPYEICVDITGVTDLKIEMYGNGNSGTHGINSVLAGITLHP